MAVGEDIAAARGGDRAAFGRLYDRYHRPVFLDLVARVRRTQDAEDALQATFLSAWVNLPRLRRPGRFVAWLFRIARNKARDHTRRDRPRMTLLGRNEDLIAAPPGHPPDTAALRELMGGLRPRTRSIVLLRVLEGWSAEEVAAAKGLSASTVRREYSRALEHLRVALERSEPDDGQDRASRRVNL